ncbi:hemin uptake protein HemP [Jannaschia donghaensis]|uniref:Hemin uptake protein n=1 Tax=Jannaschia donghaensis TaxID=420998 RepID=A0A0M6YM72_9RHOB|nr:hemin uptake protein HemP [Jannaschia donghaensis]CTQ51458.1 Hemin uptake protein [Jannaschia donghaensis]
MSDPASTLRNNEPVYRAEELLNGGTTARIALGDQVYVLRLTRAGKLILTK